jgi:hypothetical protein
MVTYLNSEYRWVSCSQDADWATSQYRHLNIKGSLHTVCGCTASHPEVWRGNTTKPDCPECTKQVTPVLPEPKKEKPTMTKHEPTNTKQIIYPGGKNGMWKSECSAGDYVAPPSDTEEQAEARVRQHAEAKAARALNIQEFKMEGGRKAKVSTEITEGAFELLVDLTDEFGDTQYAAATMNYDQLWEHVHNCLDALERMGRDQKPKVQL